MPRCTTPGCLNDYSVRGPVQSKLRRCALCCSNIHNWDKRAVDEAMEYQRKLFMRSDRMAQVVSDSSVNRHTNDRRREIREEREHGEA